MDLFPESVGVANLPSFEPTDPDSFEKDCDEEPELDSLDEDDYIRALLNPSLPAYRDASTPSSLTSLSGSMDSMDLTEDLTNSEYSAMTHSTSNYQPPLAFRNVDYGSQSIGVDPKHITTPTFLEPAGFSDSDTAGFFDSFKTQFPSNFFETVQVVKPQSDDGPYRPSVGIAPHSLFTATQGASLAFPMDSPVGTALAAQNNTGPNRKKFICPECGHREYSFYSFLF